MIHIYRPLQTESLVLCILTWPSLARRELNNFIFFPLFFIPCGILQMLFYLINLGPNIFLIVSFISIFPLSRILLIDVKFLSNYILHNLCFHIFKRKDSRKKKLLLSEYSECTFLWCVVYLKSVIQKRFGYRIWPVIISFK